MDIKEITESQKAQYNKLVTHVIQSWAWGEFREKVGTKLKRYGLYKKGKLKTSFQITFHKIPLTNYYIGYSPRGPKPDKDLAKALEIIAKKENCAFIRIEPDIPIDKNIPIDKKFKKSPKTIFTKYQFILDLTPSEEELLKNLSPKTRYNVRLAQKKEVLIEERTDDKAFEIYLKLYFETTLRQGYFGHNQSYHRLVWQTLKEKNMARLLISFYQKKPLSCWMLLNFKDTLYYPYGGSSLEHKEVMANNLLAWEAIRLGKKLDLKKFDMWGASHPNVTSDDPHYGFHNFKKGYGGKLVEYIGTFDLIINKPLYHLFNFIDQSIKLKVTLLKILGK